MLRVTIVTSRFPFGRGEEFLSAEIPCWTGTPRVELTILPEIIDGVARVIPSGVRIDHSIARYSSRGWRLLAVVAALCSGLFWRELLLLSQRRILRTSTVARALLAVARTFQIRRGLSRFFLREGPPDLLYTYWNDAAAVAAGTLRQRVALPCLVSRAHGSDLYEYCRPFHYMPLKRQIVAQFDLVAAVSCHGAEYYVRQYGAPRSAVATHRLGVEMNAGTLVLPSPPGVLRIASIASCLPIKRLNVIIDGIALFCARTPDVHLHWAHFGGGRLLQTLKRYASIRLTGLRNCDFTFFGHLSHPSLLRALDREGYDVLLNTSASEGIPVSLMEGMSRGIPAVAPAIGGVPELVLPGAGLLLPPNPSPDDVAKALGWSLDAGKQLQTRAAAQAVVRDRFNGERNYAAFLAAVISLAAERSA